MKNSKGNHEIIENIRGSIIMFGHNDTLKLVYDRFSQKCEILPECSLYDEPEDAILRAKILADDKNQYVEIPQISRFDTFNLIEALFSKHPMAQFNFQVEAEGLKEEWETFVNDLEERDLKEWARYWGIDFPA